MFIVKSDSALTVVRHLMLETGLDKVGDKRARNSILVNTFNTVQWLDCETEFYFMVTERHEVEWYFSYDDAKSNLETGMKCYEITKLSTNFIARTSTILQHFVDKL